MNQRVALKAGTQPAAHAAFPADSPASRGENGEAAILARAEAIAREIAAGALERDQNRILPVPQMALVKQARLHALRVPPEFGGPGTSWLTTARVFVALAAGDPNVAQAIQSQGVFIEILRADAPPLLRQRVLAAIAGGALVTNAVAERGGQFYGDARTTIRQAAEGYRLDGTKYYATGSAFAEFVFVSARDEAGADVTAVIPSDRAGVTIVDDWNGFGQRTTASGTVRLEGVAVTSGEIFVPVPASARRWHAQAAAQVMHAAIDAGIARAAFADALILCREHGRPLREAGVERAGDDPYVLEAIGAMSARVEAAVALVERGARLLDGAADAFFTGAQDEAADVAASIAVGQARIATAEAALSVSERLFEVANATGSDRRLGLDRHWRNARAHTTHDPLSYKFKFIGDFLLNGRIPPATAKF
jgi:alkylation response protein AidB-like acyl-CoA dehydrogenase